MLRTGIHFDCPAAFRFERHMERQMSNHAYDYRRQFANSKSALRAAGPHNPRNLPCPTCNEPNRLTPADRARGYQCDACADRAEGGGY